ncbi:hypothetical protein [Chryseosolibacter indicus]|uniref:ASCH domain-containing protein n=1 Tax=Chryseosolibacter indicus TaxID=2782351 RepID=A0ABS5VSE9_9BACT|nr:hypothetical protein [Chryseosolibacter indicus]MBT1702931.1 hypothetical protein [Chryseosolibacter indicus]
MAKLITMRVVSIKQPFAYLLAKGFKLNETRSFNTNYRGEIYIHASQKVDFHDLELININDHFKRCISDRSLLVQGAIIGKFTITDSVATERFITNYKEASNSKDKLWLSPQERAFGNYLPNRFAWIGKDHKMLSNPIKCRGQLGIWRYEAPEELLEEMEVQHG